MIDILVGIDDSERGDRALAWAARYAQRVQGNLTLVSVVDPGSARQLGLEVDAVDAAAQKSLDARRDRLAAQFPGVGVTTHVVQGKVIDELVDASAGHNMVVLGTHHVAGVSEAVGGAKALRVSVSVNIPTVIVPADWAPEKEGTGIVVGVGPDQVSENAVMFGVQEALRLDESLELVSAWGLPPLLTLPAEAMGGGISPVGAQFQRKLEERARLLRGSHPALHVTGLAVEGSSPAKTLTDHARGHRMLVLGTHSRTVLGRALFGSTVHAVLLNPSVPTVVVPLP